MMKIYLKASEKDIFEFPVTPHVYDIETSSVLNTTNIHSLGEVVQFGGKGLRECELSGFFPNRRRKYTFVSSDNYPKASDCVRKIKKWENNGTKIRLIITGSDVNVLMMIESFTYGEHDASRDIEFKIKLKEYREIKIPNKVDKLTKNFKRASKDTEQLTQAVNKTLNLTHKTYKTYKVKKGDNIMKLAKKWYGKTSYYTKIKSKNKKKYPSLAKNNILKAGWVLKK